MRDVDLGAAEAAVDIAVADGRMVGVRGRVEDRINHGRLGPKGLYGWQGQRHDRLTTPLVRRAAKGARDTEAIDIVGACEQETKTQLARLKTRLKQAAPQALLVAD